MIEDIFIPFIAIGLSELGDKTQLAVFCMSSRSKKLSYLFAGIMAAFLVTTIMAVTIGRYITELIPGSYIRLTAAIVFIMLGVITILRKPDDTVSCEIKTPVLSAFSLILLMELGDKSQIASAVFASQYSPFGVFIGVFIALGILSALALYLGKLVFAKINLRSASIIAGSLFIIIGIASLFIKQ